MKDKITNPHLPALDGYFERKINRSDIINGKHTAKEEEELALFMKRIINFQQMIRCKEVLLRKDWRIINLLLVSGLQEDGPG